MDADALGLSTAFHLPGDCISMTKEFPCLKLGLGSVVNRKDSRITINVGVKPMRPIPLGEVKNVC